ncbi:MAG: peptidoglycan DD-metalloendopeptidase family protein, partial [Acidimicrobiales bacterium]
GLALVVAVLSLLITVVCPAASPAQTVDEARDQREATRAEQARIAEELDLLEADAATMGEALEGLGQAIAFQQAEVAGANAGLRTAQASVAAARSEADATGGEIERIRSRVTEAVINTYTGGLEQQAEQLLASSSATEAQQRNHLLDVVRTSYDEDLELLRTLRERQRRAITRADAAVTQAAALEAKLAAAQAELDRQWQTQAAIAAALQARIGDVEGEAQRLADAEAGFTRVINERLAEEEAVRQAAAAATGPAPSARPSFDARSASGFIVPTDGEITSGFGYRVHPILGYSRFHAGIDIGASEGTTVWASKEGEVILAGWNGGYGNCVIIAHEGGMATLYGHMSELAVSEGQVVEQGETIGWVGSTGASTGPHLHFETWVGGEPYDPYLFL